MSTTGSSAATVVRPKDRLEDLFVEVAELTGQRNAIDGRLVEIAAEIDRDGLWGMTGARSLAAMVAWKFGVSSGNAATITAVAQRLEQFPRCAQGVREGRVSLDQIGVIAKKAADGSDDHYADLVAVATVSQLHTAVNQEPRPDPEQPEPEHGPRASITKSSDEEVTRYRITLPHAEAAKFDAALTSHQEALIADWKHDRENGDAGEGGSDQAPPFPNTGDAFMRLVDAGWDAEAAARPHGHRTTVVVHLDVEATHRAVASGSAALGV